MKLSRILMLAALLSALPPCAASTKFISPPTSPQLAQPDSELTKDCNLPVDVGKDALPQTKTEKFWIMIGGR